MKIVFSQSAWRETAAELDHHVESGHGLAGVVVQGVDLGDAAIDWPTIELAGAFFVGCRIPDGMVIGEDEQADARRFYRTPSGITLVTAAMLARLA